MATDWRRDLKVWHPRLFRTMTEEPGLSFGYPHCERGWQDILVRRSRESQDDGAAPMKVITIIDDEERARSIYVRPDGDVTVFDRDRKFRFRTEVAGAATTWQLLERVIPAIIRAEAIGLKIEAVADRCRTGWRPAVPDEIDADIPQRTLRRAHFGVDLLRYPEDDEFYSPATILMGIEIDAGRSTSFVGKMDGTVGATGEILWIDAARAWAVCEDGFWWTPGKDDDG